MLLLFAPESCSQALVSPVNTKLMCSTFTGLTFACGLAVCCSVAMQKIAPRILTTGEILKYAAIEVQRKVLGKKMPAYKPQFTKCIDHFLIHAGGAKVLDGIGKELQLDEYALEPSRMVLHDYGNVSSSTTWYTLGYLESVRGVRKADQLLQIGVGSGKCESCYTLELQLPGCRHLW